VGLFSLQKEEKAPGRPYGGLSVPDRCLQEGWRGISCPEVLWMPHPWTCSRPGWMGFEQPSLVEGVAAHGRGGWN